MMNGIFRPTCVVLLVSSLLLGGCSGLVRSEFEAPELRVPEHWQSQQRSRAVSLDPWWQAFDDAQLNRLVEQVLQQNNDLALATLTLQKARLQAGLSEQELYPQLSSSLSGSRSQPLEGGDSSRSYSASLSIRYEADLWGKLAARADAAQWQALASAEDRESTAQALVATTASLYWQLGYLQQRLVLADQSLAYAGKTLQLAQNQFENGAVSRLNVLEAERSLAAQKASKIELERQLSEARNALAVLLNQPPLDDDQKPGRLPEGKVPEVGAGVPADLLARRPDVKAAFYTLRAALDSKDATLADYLPTLTLTGQVGDSSSALRELLRDPIGTLGAGLVLPFLQWQTLQLNRQIADVEYESAVVSYRDTLYQAFEEVDNALSARQHYALQGEQLQQQYAAAQAAERLYEIQYRNGAVGIQNWLDAQDNRRSAESSLLENRYHQLTATATLYQALGGRELAPSEAYER